MSKLPANIIVACTGVVMSLSYTISQFRNDHLLHKLVKNKESIERREKWKKELKTVPIDACFHKGRNLPIEYVKDVDILLDYYEDCFDYTEVYSCDEVFDGSTDDVSFLNKILTASLGHHSIDEKQKCISRISNYKSLCSVIKKSSNKFNSYWKPTTYHRYLLSESDLFQLCLQCTNDTSMCESIGLYTENPMEKEVDDLLEKMEWLY